MDIDVSALKSLVREKNLSLEILLISSQNWHVRIFIKTPFSEYPVRISYGRFW